MYYQHAHTTYACAHTVVRHPSPCLRVCTATDLDVTLSSQIVNFRWLNLKRRHHKTDTCWRDETDSIPSLRQGCLWLPRRHTDAPTRTFHYPTSTKKKKKKKKKHSAIYIQSQEVKILAVLSQVTSSQHHEWRDDWAKTPWKHITSRAPVIPKCTLMSEHPCMYDQAITQLPETWQRPVKGKRHEKYKNSMTCHTWLIIFTKQLESVISP